MNSVFGTVVKFSFRAENDKTIEIRFSIHIKETKENGSFVPPIDDELMKFKCPSLNLLVFLFPSQPNRRTMSLCVRLSTSSIRWCSTKLRGTSSLKTRVSFCLQSLLFPHMRNILAFTTAMVTLAVQFIFLTHGLQSDSILSLQSLFLW